MDFFRVLLSTEYLPGGLDMTLRDTISLQADNVSILAMRVVLWSRWKNLSKGFRVTPVHKKPQ
ncbi:hypothetical protein N7456_012260 [Penicillium angulare]|uniref:Uncharacterized protein n=1 Tax=Penicillium angulare TaxID=116970 RepID=A0A9W9EVH1_9EURO|nr:hypothetical protein N7456_012260 [Penicillium angulare]